MCYFAESEKMFKAEVETGGKHVASEVNRRRIIHRAKMKSVRISVVIVVAFIVCWTPYYIMMIMFMFLNPDEHVSNYTKKCKNFLCLLRLSKHGKNSRAT
jgi:gonadotropin-releasing hormone receptor